MVYWFEVYLLVAVVVALPFLLIHCALRFTGAVWLAGQRVSSRVQRAVPFDYKTFTQQIWQRYAILRLRAGRNETRVQTG